MDDTLKNNRAPSEWLAALDRADAQYAAGDLVSGDDIMRELHETIARMEAKRAASPKRPAA